MLTSQERDQSQTKGTSFFSELELELNSQRHRLQTLSSNLYDTGFYGPPSEAKSSSAPEPNNVRQRVSNEINLIRESIATLEYQVSQITG